MEFGYIPPLSQGGFHSLLLPDVAAAAQNGVPLTLLGMKDGNLACGALAGYVEDGLFSIVSFYISPDYRRKGGGRQLLKTLEAILSHVLLTDESAVLYGIQVRFTATQEEHEGLGHFLEAMGFERQENVENIYYTTLAQVSPALTRGILGDHVQPFAALPAGVLSILGKQAAAAGAPLPELPLTAPELERDLSVALLSAGKAQAYAAFDFSCGGQLTLAALWSGTAGPTGPSLLLRAALTRALAKYPPDTVLAVQTTNSASCRLVQSLLPKASPIFRTYIHPFKLY